MPCIILAIALSGKPRLPRTTSIIINKTKLTRPKEKKRTQKGKNSSPFTVRNTMVWDQQECLWKWKKKYFFHKIIFQTVWMRPIRNPILSVLYWGMNKSLVILKLNEIVMIEWLDLHEYFFSSAFIIILLDLMFVFKRWKFDFFKKLMGKIAIFVCAGVCMCMVEMLFVSL